MSLVNQMLKDLDARHAPADGSQVAASAGIAMIDTRRTDIRPLLIFGGWGLAALLAVFVGYKTANLWLEREPETEGVFAASPLISEQIRVVENAGSMDTAVVQPVPVTPDPERSSETAEHGIITSAPHQQALVSRPEPSVAPEPSLAPESTKPVKALSSRQKADLLFDRAQLAIATQDYLEGESLLRQALFEYPGYHNARAQLAALLEARGNGGAAERLLAQGLANDKRALELVRPYAQLLVARGDTATALTILNEAIAGRTVDSETFALRAAILHRAGHHAGAAADYRRALEQQPGNAVWWAGLAIAEDHAEQFGRALKTYRQAVRMPLDDVLREYVKKRIQALQHTDGL